MKEMPPKAIERPRSIMESTPVNTPTFDNEVRNEEAPPSIEWKHLVISMVIKIL